MDLSLIKQALFKIKALQEKVNSYQNKQAEPIAIVGVGCRFPAGVDGLEHYWQLLQPDREITKELPKNRWDVDKCYSNKSDLYQKMANLRGAFLDDITSFDPEFFGISPKEALYMDPSQRILIECSWEAFENAGYSHDALAGSKTGIYVSTVVDEYLSQQSLDTLSEYSGVGNISGLVAGRIANILGTCGPAIAIDTTCSSSLVAIHQACESLRNDEIQIALVGASSIHSSPINLVMAMQSGMLAIDGRCKTFDEQADGYVCGEGCVAIVLKRLSDAKAANDNILALIKGSAVNQNGSGEKLTQPNGLAQQAVIQQALINANVEAHEIDYIEAHGAGLLVNDAIEIEALAQIFCTSHNQQHPLLVGSVKTNIGHLGAAAGLASLLKVVVALQHQRIPIHKHCQQLNSRISWAQLPIKVTTQTTPWVTSSKSRIAGISAFGLSGTNAHIILAEPPQGMMKKSEVDRPLHLFMLSAKSPEALEAQLERYQTWLPQSKSNINDICFTTRCCRSHFNYRTVFVTSSIADLLAQLANASRQITHIQDKLQPYSAWLFTDLSDNVVNLSREFYETQPEYRLYMNEVNNMFKKSLNIDLISQLFSEDANKKAQQSYHEVLILFMMQYSFGCLLRRWGIKPNIIIAYGIGEYTAACLSGVFTLQDAIKLVVMHYRLLIENNQKEALITEALMVVQGIKYNLPRISYISGLRATEISQALTETRYWFNLVSNKKQYKVDYFWLKEKKIPYYLTINGQISFIKASNSFEDLSESKQKTKNISWASINDLLKSLYLSGFDIDWLAYEQYYHQQKVLLPTYAFQRQHYWLQAAKTEPEYNFTQDANGAQTIRYPFLGKQLDIAHIDEAYFNAKPSLKQFPFLNHHRLFNMPLFPVGAFIDIALSAANRLNISPVILKQLEFGKPLFLPENRAVKIQSIFRATEHYDYQFKCLSKEGNAWQTHASAILKADFSLGNQDKLLIKLPAETKGISGKEFYRVTGEKEPALHALYGSDFHCIERYVSVDDGGFCKLSLPPESHNYTIHPIIIHACFQTLLILASSNNYSLSMPIGLKKCCIYQQPTTSLWCHAIPTKTAITANTIESAGKKREIGDIRLYDEQGKLIAEFLGLTVQFVAQNEMSHVAEKVVKQNNRIKEENFITRLKKIEKSERKVQVNHYLIQNAAWVLGMTSGELNPKASLISLGLDTAMSLKLKVIIKNSLYIDIPEEYFLQGYCIDEMSEQIWAILVKQYDWIAMFE